MDRGYWGGASSCPGRSGSIDLFALPQGPLDNSSPKRSSLPGRPGVRPPGLHRHRHLLMPTKRVRDRAQVNCHPLAFPLNRPLKLALRHGLVP